MKTAKKNNEVKENVKKKTYDELLLDYIEREFSNDKEQEN